MLYLSNKLLSGAGLLSLRVSLVLAVLAMFSSIANAVVVKGSDYLAIDDASESYLLAKRNSVVDILEGAILEKAVSRHNASVTIDGGTVGKLVASGYSTVSVISGSFDKVVAKKGSRVTLGNASDLSRLVLKGDAIVELIATELEFDGRFLTGYWENGSAFSIRARSRGGDISTDIFGNVITSNSPGPIQPVPVPAAAWMFMSALVGLGLMGRKRH